MLHAPVNDKKTKPETSRSEVEQESERLKSFSGWGDHTTQGQNSRLAAMQQAYGNQAALRMMNGGVLQRKCACGNTAGSSGSCAECQGKREGILQTKLKISEPGDRYEQEADRVADQVMRMAEPTIQRQVESEKDGVLQRKAIANLITPLQHRSTDQDQVSEVPPIVHEVLSSSGQPLNSETRRFLEPRFGKDFSEIRVHTDSRATESARAVNALAYAVGRDIIFGEQQYAPQTQSGQKLLAHEVTHVIQQSNSVRRIQREEADAEQTSNQLQTGNPRPVPRERDKTCSDAKPLPINEDFAPSTTATFFSLPFHAPQGTIIHIDVAAQLDVPGNTSLGTIGVSVNQCCDVSDSEIKSQEIGGIGDPGLPVHTKFDLTLSDQCTFSTRFGSDFVYYLRLRIASAMQDVRLSYSVTK